TVLHDGWHLTRRYQELLKLAYGLRDTTGASAVVYTQIADVENETNGLLTYDRAVVKPLPDYIKAASEGRFLPLPPAPISHDLIPTSQDAPQTWAYTTVKPADDWAQPGFHDAAWRTGPAPFGQGVDGVRTPWTDTPGDIWLRRTVTLPATLPAKLTILARHDEDVEVYVNGVLAASATGFTSDYAELPLSDAARAALKPDTNILAVHCRQTIGGQVIDVDPTARP
ncbi:MAG: glycoside hydrolase family 2, partial [Armatimonadota bacterium]|nr:glycoside hydrolase family 2 [Armatimonadota bacterium]